MPLFKRRKLGPVVAVVLGGGILDDGKTPSQATVLRARTAAELALAHPQLTIIVSGDGPPKGRVARKTTEAESMRRILRQQGVARKRILVEDESIDTVGNAILVTARFLHGEKPRKLYVITSPFHMERAVLLFESVLPQGWEIVAHPSAVSPNDSNRAIGEGFAIVWTRAFFAGVDRGNLSQAIERLYSRGKPFYREIGWLQRMNRRLVDKRIR